MTSVWNVCWNDFFLCDYVSMSHGKEKKCRSHRSSSSSSWKWWIEERDFDRRRWQIEFFCHCQRAFWIFFSIFTMLVVFFLWHAARHIVVYQSIFVWILIGCDTPFSCQRQRHCCFFFSTPLFFSFLFVIVEVPVHFISNRTATSAVKSTALSTRSLESLVHSTQKKERQRSFLPEETSVEGIEQLPLSLSPFLSCRRSACDTLVVRVFFLLANLKAANASFPMCLVIDNTRFLACPYPHIHTHIIA